MEDWWFQSCFDDSFMPHLYNDVRQQPNKPLEKMIDNDKAKIEKKVCYNEIYFVVHEIVLRDVITAILMIKIVSMNLEQQTLTHWMNIFLVEMRYVINEKMIIKNLNLHYQSQYVELAAASKSRTTRKEMTEKFFPNHPPSSSVFVDPSDEMFFQTFHKHQSFRQQTFLYPNESQRTRPQQPSSSYVTIDPTDDMMNCAGSSDWFNMALQSKTLACSQQTFRDHHQPSATLSSDNDESTAPASNYSNQVSYQHHQHQRYFHTHKSTITKPMMAPYKTKMRTRHYNHINPPQYKTVRFKISNNLYKQNLNLDHCREMV